MIDNLTKIFTVRKDKQSIINPIAFSAKFEKAIIAIFVCLLVIITAKAKLVIIMISEVIITLTKI